MTLPDLTPPPPSRSPWQRLYAYLLRLRRSRYRDRARRLPRPVLSVGNLHWGGSGKTPLTAAIAGHLRDRGHTVAILSRGYKGRGKGVRIVSTGEGPLLGPTVVGDEPVSLAGELPGVGIVVCGDRYRAGVHALERFDPAPDLLVLDDAFSHVRIARDLDILAFPAADPFAGGRLLPSGRLREPLAAAQLADAVVLTGASRGSGDALAKALATFGYEGPGFASETVALAALRDDGDELEAGSRVIAVSGIARPESFHRSARERGFEIVATLALPDHHDYSQSTLEALRRLWRDHTADVILTTSKDHVKLLGRLDLPLARLPIAAAPEPAFWEWIDEELESLLAS